MSEEICKCSMKTKLVGDGCHICNPEYAASMSEETWKMVPVATLHDDGYFTINEASERYKSGHAGWRKEVYSAEQLATIRNERDRLQAENEKLQDIIASYENQPPIAWINRDGTHVELSTKSTVYGSHTIPLIMQHEVVYAPNVPEIFPGTLDALGKLGHKIKGEKK